MKIISVEDTDKLYTIGEQNKVFRHSINNEELAKYCFLVKKLKKELGELSEDEFWKPLLQRFLRYHYDQCVAPLSANHSFIIPAQLLLDAKQYLNRIKMLYSQHTDLVKDIFNYLTELTTLNKNPLLDTIKAIIKPNEKIALLIRDSRLIPSVEAMLEPCKNRENIEIISIQQLKKNLFYQQIILLGATCWFPDFAFTSPRAKEIHVLCYNWIRDKKRGSTVFSNPTNFQVRANEYEARANKYEANLLSNQIDNQDSGAIDTSEHTIIQAEEVLPTIDWHHISKTVSQLHATNSHEGVLAKLFFLENSLGVLLEYDDKATTLVIDLEEEIAPVNRKPSTDIKPGMFVLLRTSGGGDLIIPLADRLLGNKAELARKAQRLWKDRLRSIIEKIGIKNTITQLKKMGSPRANEVNLRNWLSYRSIKTDDYKDFLAIMTLLQYGSKAEKFWEIMKLIDHAHRKAGRHIRKLLLKQVKTADLKDLERLGKKTFELPEVEGGSLTAFRVTDISADNFNIAYSKLPYLVDLFNYNSTYQQF